MKPGFVLNGEPLAEVPGSLDEWRELMDRHLPCPSHTAGTFTISEATYVSGIAVTVILVSGGRQLAPGHLWHSSRTPGTDI